jgi:hypothetical protein
VGHLHLGEDRGDNLSEIVTVLRQGCLAITDVLRSVGHPLVNLGSEVLRRRGRVRCEGRPQLRSIDGPRWGVQAGGKKHTHHGRIAVERQRARVPFRCALTSRPGTNRSETCAVYSCSETIASSAVRSST